MESDNTPARSTVAGTASQMKALEPGYTRVDKGTDLRSFVGLEITPEVRADFLRQALVGIDVPPETPLRIARWLENYVDTRQYVDDSPERELDLAAVLGEPFEDQHDELVLVKDIQFIALCAHHLLPFKGSAAVGYIPNGRVLGLSKAARLVELYTRTPTLQEHITSSVADSLDRVLRPKGVIVVLYNVMHSCMTMRGIKDPEATTTTSAVRGVFKDSQAARSEALTLLKG